MYIILLLTSVGVAWAFLVRSLLLRSMKHHKIHYKLSEGIDIHVGGGHTTVNGVPVKGQVVGGRERLKLEVQPLAVKSATLSHGPWKQLLKSPPVM